MGRFVDHEKKIVFVHIPRTGGGSVANTNKRRVMPITQPKVFGGHKSFLGEGQPEYKCTCFVRNPYDRFVSIFHYFNGKSFKFFRKLGMNKRLPFNEYVEFTLASDNNFYKPMSWFVEGATDLWIGRFENYENDYRELASMFGVTELELPHVHRTPNRKPWEEYYNQEQKDKIYELYKEDFERFGYER